MEDVQNPPIERIGALTVNAFMKKTERRSLASALNRRFAAHTLANWRPGDAPGHRRMAGTERGQEA